MANLSSFNGVVTFETKKNPWTPEGFLFLYDILQSVDSSTGAYGVCISEEVMKTSADFLTEMLKQQATSDYLMLDYWGNGRWSASGTIDSFEMWTMRLPDTEIESDKHKKYAIKREKLLQLMYENGWFLDFAFLDEEVGSSFIEEGHILLEVHKLSVPKNNSLGDIYNYEFITHTNVTESYDHNLKNYSIVIEGDRYSDYFYDQTQTIAHLLQIPEDLIATFRMWIIDNDWDEHIGVWNTYDNLTDLPEELEKEWRKTYATFF